VPGRPGAALALATIVGVVAGCGRVGYDPAIHSRQEVDSEAPRPEPAPDVPSPDAPTPDAGPPDASAVDATSPADAALPGDMAPPPVDAAVPVDSPRDVADSGAAMSPCLSFPASDMIADFENGNLNINRVGVRGGRPFRMVAPEYGTLANVATSFCGQRAMQMQPIGTPAQAPLAQGPLMPNAANVDDELYDARAYRGIVIALRASTPTNVRLKLPNHDTISSGNNHFQVSLTVGTEWDQVSLAWSGFKQAGTAQFPSFDVSTLYAVEISASLPPGASLWVDNVAFLR
jgi:hypothetical protein